MDNNENKSYIERIEINGLWGRFDVDWTLHQDVNILVGENGTGKSTILKLVGEILKGSIDVIDDTLVSSKMPCKVLIKLSENRYIWYPVRNGIDGLYDSETFLCQENISFDNFEYYDWDFDDDKRSKMKYRNVKFNFQLLQTFENQLLEEDTIQKIGNNEIKTSLDFILYNLEKSYWKYQIELFERIVDLGLDKDKVNKIQRRFYFIITYFLNCFFFK